MKSRIIQGNFPAAHSSFLNPRSVSVKQHLVGPRPTRVQAFGAGAMPNRVQPRAGENSAHVDPAWLGLTQYGGQPLPRAVQAHMEVALGADFSDVRIHVGPQAERIGAIAFTTGNDIYFAPGRFQPETQSGRQLLGHELAHVIQQRRGRVVSPLSTGVVVIQDRALEAEADQCGARAAHLRLDPRLGVVQPYRRTTIPGSVGHNKLSTGAAAFGSRRATTAIQRNTAIFYNQTNYRSANDTIAQINHNRVMHNNTNRNIVAYICGWRDYQDAMNNGCDTCNHYISYATIRDAITTRLANAPAGGGFAQGSLGAAVRWLNNVNLPGAVNVNVGSSRFALNQNPWNQPLGAVPAVNIAPHHNNGGTDYYDERIVESEVDDLIYNLANDPRNLFYWPDSTAQQANGIDTPTNPHNLTHTNFGAITGRLAAYRATLQALGLNV